MTQEEFTERMVKIASDAYDPESDHASADDLISEYLRDQGLHEAMDAFEGMTKWYA